MIFISFFFSLIFPLCSLAVINNALFFAKLSDFRKKFGKRTKRVIRVAKNSLDGGCITGQLSI